MSQPERRVVVTGLGAITPIGLGCKAYWEGLRNGKSGAAEITHFDASKFRTRFACEATGFNAGDYLDKREVRRTDPFVHFALSAAAEAVEDAQINFDTLNKERAGVIVGSGIGGINAFEEEVGGYYTGDGTPRFSPFFIPKMIVDLASGHISIKYGLKGPNYAVVSACATGSHAIIDAYLLIKNGLADMMVAGGSEASITPAAIGGFNAMKAMSLRNDDPETASRPFDKDRDGFVLGEGGGILILETLESAEKRGAEIYAELAGISMTADAYHITAPDPEGDGVIRLMRQVVEHAGLEFPDIDHINTHGTSTPLGDVAETKAIKTVFGEHAAKINVNSTKSMTGHLLGAAGAVEAVATILAVKNDLVPPTINHFTDDPACDLNYTFNEAQQRRVDVAISNTFGFGGHNASLLFKKFKA